jgi:peroxiredoxin Q/BCP
VVTLLIRHIVIGTGAKLETDFGVRAILGDKISEVNFNQLLSDRTIVSVYMRNNTPSCDRQVQHLMQQTAELQQRGYLLIGLSRDSAKSQLKYAQKNYIPFTLVSDPDDLFSKAADSIVTKSMYGRTYQGPARAAFLLDKSGTVLRVIEKVDTKNHGAELLSLTDGVG